MEDYYCSYTITFALEFRENNEWNPIVRQDFIWSEEEGMHWEYLYFIGGGRYDYFEEVFSLSEDVHFEKPSDLSFELEEKIGEKYEVGYISLPALKKALDAFCLKKENEMLDEYLAYSCAKMAEEEQEDECDNPCIGLEEMSFEELEQFYKDTYNDVFSLSERIYEMIGTFEKSIRPLDPGIRDTDVRVIICKCC